MTMLALVASVYAVLGALVIAHVVANERSVPTCLGWSAFCLLIPFLGPLLYLLFGVRHMTFSRKGAHAPAIQETCSTVEFNSAMRNREVLVRLVDSISCTPLCAGNSVLPLVNGAGAYPEMMRAIESAQCSIAFSTYQFDYDDVGLQFCEALCLAARRGVQVRVLVDFFGVWLHRSSIVNLLRRGGVNARYFNPPISMAAVMNVNFRYHRKLLVVDGYVGFTGGMNIRAAHLVERNLRRVNQDVHFRVEGPAVAQLQSVFAADWFYFAAERLSGPDWFPGLVKRGSSVVRGISSGPNLATRTNYELLLGVLACAHASVRIATPYFLPDDALLSSLLTAVRRGVEVRLVLSGDNFPIVHWAHLWVARWLVREGVRIFIGAARFDHSKLMVVDGAWCFVGSSNWDPRSLAMNFEFDLEVHDARLAGWLESFIDGKIEAAKELTTSHIEGMSKLAVVRNGLARIGCSYL